MRKVRVYDNKGDFVIEVPDGAKVTFGYFNPSSSLDGGAFGDNRRQNVSRETALRIYEKAEKGNQLACFIGVKGFRDESVTITRMQESVTITTHHEDDGEGLVSYNAKQHKQIVAVKEPDQYD